MRLLLDLADQANSSNQVASANPEAVKGSVSSVSTENSRRLQFQEVPKRWICLSCGPIHAERFLQIMRDLGVRQQIKIALGLGAKL